MGRNIAYFNMCRLPFPHFLISAGGLLCVSAGVEGNTGGWYLCYAGNIIHVSFTVVSVPKIKPSPKAEDLLGNIEEVEVEEDEVEEEEESDEYLGEDVADADYDSTQLYFRAIFYASLWRTNGDIFFRREKPNLF